MSISVGKKISGFIKIWLVKISPKLEASIHYFYLYKEILNWKRPQDNINAKLQWLKIYKYYNNESVTMCADKYMVRKWMENKELSMYMPKLYFVCDKPESIVWESLPEQYVVKCNHACRTNIIVKDKSTLIPSEAVEQLNKWLKIDYWKQGELQYKFIKKKIIIEEYLGDGENLKTYKFFCFNGIPRVLYLSMNEDKYIDYYDMDFNRLPYSATGHLNYPGILQKPDNFEILVDIAKRLCEDFPFVRVDLYDSFGKIYLSEMTFLPTGGFISINPHEVINQWGKWLEI